MKRLAVIFGFLFLSLTAFCQFNIDNIAFKIHQIDIFEGRENADGYFVSNEKTVFTGESFMYFQGETVYNFSGKDHLRGFVFEEDPEYANPLVKGTTYPGYLIPCIDAGYSKCHLSVMYKESTDLYIIVAEYSNTRIAFFGRVTEERPWENVPIDYVAEGMKYRTNPEYTAEDLERFADKLSGFFGKTITKGMVVAWSWNSLME